MTLTTEYIDDFNALEAFVAACRGLEWIAIDTEFMRERTYFPRLCLVQIAAGERVACIDVLALADCSPLAGLLADPGILKVLHSARQDVEAVLCTWQVMLEPLFDTQVAAAMLGLSEQVSYAELVQTELDVHLEKQHTRTDWSRRPLSAGQLEYAAADVYYLAQLYPVLQDRLALQDRLGWLAQECALLTQRGLYEADPEQSWRRVKGAGRMDARQHAALRALAAWRETEALRSDRPRGFILRDNVLVAMAQALPRDRAALAGIDELPAGSLRRHEETWLALIDAACEQPPDPDNPAPRRAERLDPEQQDLLGRLLGFVRQEAGARDISPTMVATRGQVEGMLRDPGADSPLLSGWRRELIGADLHAVITGDRRLVRDGERLTLAPA